MLKVITPVIVTTALMFVHDGGTGKVFAKCAASNEEIYNSIASHIENSGIAKLSNLNCEKITEINKYDPNSLSITSGRKEENIQSACQIVRQIHANTSSELSMKIKTLQTCLLKYLKSQNPSELN